MTRWLPTSLGERLELEPLHLGAQRSHHQHDWASNGVGSKRHLKPEDRQWGIWRFGSQDDEKNQAKRPSSQDWTFVAYVPHEVMVARFQFKHHVAPLPLLGCMHALHFLVLSTYGRLLVSCFNP
jgi:hypothetical protein